MDKNLDWRYRELYESYRVEDDSILLFASQVINEYMIKDPEFLRWDAAYFLLINFDHMIIKPYFSMISDIPRPNEFENMTEAIFRDRINLAIDIIMSDLRRYNPYSAHSILVSINNNWNSLSRIFGWG